MSTIQERKIVAYSDLSKGFAFNPVTKMIETHIGAGLTYGNDNEVSVDIGSNARNALKLNNGKLELIVPPVAGQMLRVNSQGIMALLPNKIPAGNIFSGNNPIVSIRDSGDGIVLDAKISAEKGGRYQSDRNVLEVKNDGLFVKGEYDTGWRRLFKGIELHSGWHKDFDMILYRRIGQMVWMWIRRSTGNSKTDPVEARFSQRLPYGLHPNGNFLIQTFEFKNGMSFPPNSGFYRIGWDGNIDWKAPTGIRGADMLSNMVPYITNHNPVNPPPGEEVNLQAL